MSKYFFLLLNILLLIFIFIACPANEGAANSGSSDTGSVIQPSSSSSSSTIPAAPAIISLNADDDTGISSSDRITKNISGLTINGTSDLNITVNLYEGASLLGYTTSNSSGNWSCDISLSEGSHSIIAKAVDASSNVSLPSNTFSIIVDTIAPVLLAKYSSINYSAAGTDYIVMIDAVSVSSYTNETGISASYNSGTKQTILTDTAGNSITLYRIYQGAESSGLRSAVSDSLNTNNIYLFDGTYTLTGGPLLISGKGINLSGESSASTIILQSVNSTIISYQATGNSQLYLQNITLSMPNNSTSNYIADDGDATYEGTLYIKNIKKSGLNAAGNLINFSTLNNNGRKTFYWNGSTYASVANGTASLPADGNTWSVTTPSYKLFNFVGTVGTTYWP